MSRHDFHLFTFQVAFQVTLRDHGSFVFIWAGLDLRKVWKVLSCPTRWKLSSLLKPDTFAGLKLDHVFRARMDSCRRGVKVVGQCGSHRRMPCIRILSQQFAGCLCLGRGPFLGCECFQPLTK